MDGSVGNWCRCTHITLHTRHSSLLSDGLLLFCEINRKKTSSNCCWLEAMVVRDEGNNNNNTQTHTRTQLDSWKRKRKKKRVLSHIHNWFGWLYSCWEWWNQNRNFTNTQFYDSMMTYNVYGFNNVSYGYWVDDDDVVDVNGWDCRLSGCVVVIVVEVSCVKSFDQV